MAAALKTCTRCGLVKPESAFPPWKASRGASRGRRSYCRHCMLGMPKQSSAREETPMERTARERRERAVRQAEQRRFEALTKENEKLKAQLHVVRQIEAPARITIYAKASPHMGDAVACALASDWHVEEPVERHKVHGLNEYNLEIARARAAAFFRNFLRLTEINARDCRINRVYLGLLGDFVTNYIHEELRESNLLGPAEAANLVLDLLCSGFDFLLKESRFAIDADAIPGNHGRMTTKPRIQNATETSLETFIYHALARRYDGNKRVNIRVAQSKMVYRRFFENFTLRAIHGDDVKFGGGIGGITIPIRKKLAAWDKAQPATLTAMGHFHQLMDGGDFLVNGSLIGYNEFAQAIGASPEEARQAFFLIHARNGGEKSVVAPIWLDEKHRQAKRSA